MSDEDRGYQKAATGKPLALEARDGEADGRLFSPSIGRNHDVVIAALNAHLKPDARVLEIASGTGEHGAFATRAMPSLKWTYSDINPESMASQRAWATHEGHKRLDGPIQLDTREPCWNEAEGPLDAIFCANMIHIAPFTAAQGLFAGAGRLLNHGGTLILYGPFGCDGDIAPSNARFSEDLKRRDPSWGVRDLERDLSQLASDNDLVRTAIIDMPANNLTVIYTKVQA